MSKIRPPGMPPEFEIDDYNVGAMELERLQAGAFPRRKVGRPTPFKERVYQTALVAWCATFEEIKATLLKGDFDGAQGLINDCHKSGMLPLDIFAEDERRSADLLEKLHNTDVEEQVRVIIG
jgi:hypothetical protein